MAILQLSNSGFVAFIDDEDYERCNKYKWHLNHRNKRITNISASVDGKTQVLSRFILNYLGDLQIDHIDRNPLNNIKNNFRFCTNAQNNINQSPPKNNTSGYKGVTRNKQLNKWTAQIKVNYKRIYLGDYKDPKDAARAYNAAAIKHFGEFAYLNKL